MPIRPDIGTTSTTTTTCSLAWQRRLAVGLPLVRTISGQPGAASVHAQVPEAKLPAAAVHLDQAATTSWRSPPSPARSRARSGLATRRRG